MNPRFNESIPTSGVVSFRFKNKLWKTITKGKGELQFHEYPLRKSQKNQIYKKVRHQIEIKMIKQVKQILIDIDRASTERINKEIEQSCKKLVNKFLNTTKTYKVKRISEGLPTKQQTKKNTAKPKTPAKKGKNISSQKNKINLNKPKPTKSSQKPSMKPGNK